MRFIQRSNAFKHSYDRMKKRGKKMEKLQQAIGLLAQDLPLPPSYRDHPLSGNFTGFRDIHVEPDWILIYAKKEVTTEHPDGILTLEVTGTHADLF
ncbi:MAG: type II toxin-antitoxin system YafQ family toxin [Methylococcaceae bacterium]